MPHATSGFPVLAYARIPVLRGFRASASTITQILQRGASLAVLLSLASGTALADSVVVFNEVMYHPAVNEPALEWVELHNQNAVDVDLSGWRLSDGVDYVFLNGTIVKGRG